NYENESQLNLISLLHYYKYLTSQNHTFHNKHYLRPFKMKYNYILVIALVGALAVEVMVAQNCGCPADLCCSRYCSCGNTSDYCGTGCQQGPCHVSANNGVVVGDIVTDDFFNGIINQADASCAGKSFYTRSAFLDAASSYSQFGTVGSVDDSKREIAAFFAHVTHETGRNSIGFDGLNNPDIVACISTISFKTALWYWMNHVHDIIVSGKGFGEAIRAINGALECNGGNTNAVSARVQHYTEYCTKLSVDLGNNLYC
ncbi:Glycoside hydrolase, family 19, catalytic, partial [Dillenia turbinata]